MMTIVNNEINKINKMFRKLLSGFSLFNFSWLHKADAFSD